MTSVRQDKWWYFIESVDVAWNPQGSADGYEYVIYNAKGKKYKSGTAYAYSTPNCNAAVKNTQVYSVKVRAYNTINGWKTLHRKGES